MEPPTSGRISRIAASALHNAEGGSSLPMLKAKSRHKKPENVRRYFHSSPEAIAEVISLRVPVTAG
jgi:hypothetical protein